MMRSRQRPLDTRARALPALLFALVWLFGYEVLPFAHQAMHAQLGAHTHGAVADASTHCHGDFCHADEAAEHARSSSSTHHGDGSLAHRGVAALAHDLTIFVPALMLAGEQPLEVTLVSRLACFERCAPPVRGPPV